jgi:antibiotic biosynthesis monooxygenase (ABM) superfamily enzyme
LEIFMDPAPRHDSAAPDASTEQVLPPAPPSIHVRAAITWLAIFPLVAIGMMAAAPLMESWHPIFRAMTLTLVVVPTAVYLVLPRLFAIYGFLAKRRSTRLKLATMRPLAEAKEVAHG